MESQRSCKYNLEIQRGYEKEKEIIHYGRKNYGNDIGESEY